ncbi:MAG: hypothetical protein JO340_21195 [Acidobacteriaceae bacterium]|nr:hypothetical protein [Acidobacteriaceae bacterium]
MRRKLIVLAVLSVGVNWRLTSSEARSPAPQTYSLTEDPGFSLMGSAIIKISRDGSREVIDQTMPAGPGRDKEYRSHRVYDFAAHKVYLKIVSDPSMACGAQDYADAAAPPELDPVSGADAFIKEIVGDGQTKEAGAENVNGIAAKVLDVTSPTSGNGKIWIAREGGFPVKVAAMGADGKTQTLLEVKQFSLAKPPASTFAIPEGCESAQAEGSVKPSTNVTAVTLRPIANYKGACPARIPMTGTITTDGPGTVFYQFGGGNMDPGQTIVFSAAGSKTVTHTMTFQPKYGNDMGVGAILEATGADASGGHGLAMQASSNAEFNITCTSGGGK